MFVSGSFRSAFLTAPTKAKLVQIPGVALEDVINEVLKFMPVGNIKWSNIRQKYFLSFYDLSCKMKKTQPL